MTTTTLPKPTETDARMVACPTCGVIASEPCRTTSNRATRAHAGRIALATDLIGETTEVTPETHTYSARYWTGTVKIVDAPSARAAAIMLGYSAEYLNAHSVCPSLLPADTMEILSEHGDTACEITRADAVPEPTPDAAPVAVPKPPRDSLVIDPKTGQTIRVLNRTDRLTVGYVIRARIARDLFCKITGKVLDIRACVAVVGPDNRVHMVMSPEAWETRASQRWDDALARVPGLGIIRSA